MKLLFFLFLPVLILAQSPYQEVQKLFDKKQYKKAEILLDSYVSENPKDLKALELLGDAYGHQEKWEDAIKTYRILVAADNKNANYHYKYGGSMGLMALKVNKLRALTMIDDIKEAFITAANLDPLHIETRWALVELYMQLPGIIGGSMEKSLKFANELQQISKVDGYLAKGYIYEYDKDPERAERYYKEAISIGGSLVCYEKLTNLYEGQKQPIKAIENLEAAHIKHQRNALHYQIGKVAAEYNVALEKGEVCLLMYIKNYSVVDGVPVAWAHYRLAQIYKNLGNKKNALEHIDIALLNMPEIKPFKSEKEAILRL